jgi:hypothetical protein
METPHVIVPDIHAHPIIRTSRFSDLLVPTRTHEESTPSLVLVQYCTNLSPSLWSFIRVGMGFVTYIFLQALF